MKNNGEDLALFSKVMWGLAGNFGGVVSDDDLAFRFEALKEFSIDQITKAGVWLLTNREKTFPAIPTTKEIVDAIKLSVEPGLETKAGLEADKILETLKEWGRDAEPLFYDKITMYLMTKRWTFRQLDVMSVKDPGFVWWRKEFISAYIDFSKDQEVSGRDLLGIELKQQDLMELANNAVKKLPA